MAKYLILIYGDEQQWESASPDERRRVDEAHAGFVTAAGAKVLGGHQLESSATSTTLRADTAGRLTTTDGPFLETKEALGGYYLLEAADLDEAVALAARLREVYAAHSGVE